MKNYLILFFILTMIGKAFSQTKHYSISSEYRAYTFNESIDLSSFAKYDAHQVRFKIQASDDLLIPRGEDKVFFGLDTHCQMTLKKKVTKRGGYKPAGNLYSKFEDINIRYIVTKKDKIRYLGSYTPHYRHIYYLPLIEFKITNHPIVKAITCSSNETLSWKSKTQAISVHDLHRVNDFQKKSEESLSQFDQADLAKELGANITMFMKLREYNY